MQELVAPSINREFGLLENFQLIFLMLCCLYSFKGWRKSKLPLDRWLFALMTFGFLFLFMEEIDYGLHYIELFNDREGSGEIRNLHNQKGVLSYMKKTIYLVVFVFFMIIPFLRSKLSNFKISNWIPSKLIVITALCLTLWSQIAQFIYHSSIVTNNSLEKNISEYEELLIYYLFLVYVLEMLNKRMHIVTR